MISQLILNLSKVVNMLPLLKNPSVKDLLADVSVSVYSKFLIMFFEGKKIILFSFLGKNFMDTYIFSLVNKFTNSCWICSQDCDIFSKTYTKASITMNENF